jgi:GNAT superfamily N-acetyltransferase
MQPYQVEVEAHPTPADVQFLDDRLYEYNAAQTGVDDGQWLAIFVRDAQQTICAGIKGWTWCGSCYISALWVDERLRGQGVGTQLLQAAEQERKREPVGVSTWSSPRIVFRHQGSISSTGMRCLRSWKTIRVITACIICTND